MKTAPKHRRTGYSDKQCFIHARIVLTLSLLLHINIAFGQQSPDKTSDIIVPPITTETSDGQIPCNASAAFAQIPGHNNMFVGRGFGPGSIEYCHNPGTGSQSAFLALYRMDWEKSKMILVNYLFRPQKLPVKEPDSIWSAYDPYAASYKGEIWIAFECALSGKGTVSSCVVPLSGNLSKFDFSRLSVLVQGGPEKFAATPILLNFNNHLYAYWTTAEGNPSLSANSMTSRGMQLEEDSKGLLWGVGSEGHSVTPDNSTLTTIVTNIDPSDPTANHISHLRSVFALGSEILAISTLGGTDGQQICHSSHEISPGCWRMSVSITRNPLEVNTFRKDIIKIPHSLENVGVEYPRIIIGPDEHKLLLGQFFPLKAPTSNSDHSSIPSGVRYVLFDSIVSSATQSLK